MNRALLSLFLCLLLPLMAEQEIVIHLATDATLEPVYIAPWSQDARRGSIDADLARKLHEVLCFDFNYNGHNEVLPHTSERKEQARTERFSTPPDTKKWKEMGARYLLKGHLSGNTLFIKAFHIGKDQDIGVYQVQLEGNLSEDRKQLHQLADSLHKALYGTEGVASTRLLYTLKKKGGNDEKPKAEIWISDYDGGNPLQLTYEDDFAIHPTFFPPKKGKASGAFLYVSYKTGQPKIYIRSLTGGRVDLFSKLRGNQLMPAISPQRNLVAFISDAAGNPDLFLQPFDPQTGPLDKPRQFFSAKSSAQASPTFSPDGSKLAFVSDKDGSPRIYILEVSEEKQSAQPKVISRLNRSNTAPAWSPDGTKIAYSSLTDGVRQIWIYDLLEDREWQLTQGSGHKENCSWAHDSLHLVCNSDTPRGSQLFLINLNQPHAVRITSGSGERLFPQWEPRSIASH